MKRIIGLLLFLFIMIPFANADVPERQDGIWARNLAGETITLDGVLNEPAWAKAESLQVIYGTPGPLPTSTWRPEFQEDAITDPIHATIKFLSDGNYLYIAFYIPDSSVGGTKDWARWDAILMSIKDAHDYTNLLKVDEFFYTYYLSSSPDTLTPWVGRSPRFLGTFGDYNIPVRTPEQIATWDAATVVIGGSSNDTLPDVAWVTEMKIDLNAIGYNVTSPEGAIVGLNFSIWDADNLFSLDPSRKSSARAWWQGPWGNANGPNIGRVYVKPDITINSTELPVIAPDAIIPELSVTTEPLIDGKLNEPEWANAYNVNIAWGDTVLRLSYPGIGPLASRQFQPELISGSKPAVLDPLTASVKMFIKDNFLYVGADVNDQLIEGTEVYDQVDGFGIILADQQETDADNSPVFKLLRMNFGQDGQLHAYDALAGLVDTGNTVIAASLKGTSTVNDNSDIDEGYQMEMKLDITGLHYPPDLTGAMLFGGIDVYDGDSFEDPANNYGTRTWWFREHAGGPAAAWMYVEDQTVGIKDDDATIPSSLVLYGNYPNPFNPSTTLKYSLPAEGNVNIIFYNVIGQEIRNTALYNQTSGIHEYNFDASQLPSGVYLYKIRFTDNAVNKAVTSKFGKMIFMK